MLRSFIRQILREEADDANLLFNVNATSGEREDMPNVSFIISINRDVSPRQIRDVLWLELYESAQHELTHIIQDYMLEQAEEWEFEMPPIPATPAYYRYEREVEAFVSGLLARIERSKGTTNLRQAVEQYLRTQVSAGFLEETEVDDITLLWLDMVDNLQDKLETSKRVSAKYIADNLTGEIENITTNASGEFVTSLLITTDDDDTGEDVPILVNYVLYNRRQ